jgi:hypothetical protein
VITLKKIVNKFTLSGVSPALRYSLLTCLVIGFAVGITNIVLLFKPYGLIIVLTAILTLLIAITIIAILLTLLLTVLKRLHCLTIIIFIISALLCVLTMYLAIYVLPLLITGMTTVYLIIMCAAGQYKTMSRKKKVLRYILIGLSGSLSLLFIILVIWPGQILKTDDRPDTARMALPYPDAINNPCFNVDDPSLPGEYLFSVYYYASPEQKIDPYHEMDVISATTIDASDILEGWSFIRRLHYGFDAGGLPLNAKVWMPEGTGPFPLVLIVHGNHEAGERSDGGYDYLGELLASHGMIAASVDQNYLNTSVLHDMLFFHRLKDEDGVRAYVILEHLRQWYEWNSDIDSPFNGKIDFENLALIGHSRGGEAVAAAAAFNRMKYYPDNGMVRLDYPFQIGTVVAVSPVHDMYRPAGLELRLKNVNYLVLHGGQDMDVSSFQGANMYRRADVSEHGIKAQVWMQYANHGQFNTIWGGSDLPGLCGLIYNERLLMQMDEQQQAAKVFINAFLQSSLFGRIEYNSLFKDFAKGSEWLPAAGYIIDYDDSRMITLDNFDEVSDIGSSSSGTVSYSAQGFDIWTQSVLPAKWDNTNRVLKLSWGSREYAEKYREQSHVFAVSFYLGVLPVGGNLYLSLCSGKQKSDEGIISFDIRFMDENGNTAVMNSNDFGGVVDPIDAPISKPLLSALIGVNEPVLQAVCIPTGQFTGLNGDIVSMEWIFNNVNVNEDGQVLYVDDLRVEY